MNEMLIKLQNLWKVIHLSSNNMTLLVNKLCVAQWHVTGNHKSWVQILTGDSDFHFVPCLWSEFISFFKLDIFFHLILFISWFQRVLSELFHHAIRAECICNYCICTLHELRAYASHTLNTNHSKKAIVLRVLCKLSEVLSRFRSRALHFCHERY